MIEAQKMIWKRYFKMKGKKTLKEVSEETGMQISRVFRILNGSEMKLSEYLLIRDLVEKREGSHDDEFSQLIGQCVGRLGQEGVSEVKRYIYRKLLTNSICHV